MSYLVILIKKSEDDDEFLKLLLWEYVILINLLIVGTYRYNMSDPDFTKEKEDSEYLMMTEFYQSH